MSPDKLVYMANQIGKFFNYEPDAEAVAHIAEHIVQFWDPRMRTAIFAHERTGGAGLDPKVLRAISQLRAAADAKTVTTSA